MVERGADRHRTQHRENWLGDRTKTYLPLVSATTIVTVSTGAQTIHNM